MSHDHREAIAEVLAAHEDYAITSNWDAAICRCGVKVCDLNDNATDADTPHRAHLADALLGSDVLAQIRAEARAEAVAEMRGQWEQTCDLLSRRTREKWAVEDEAARLRARVEAVCNPAEKPAGTYKRACIVTTGQIRDALTAGGSA